MSSGIYVAGGASLLALCAAPAVLDAERLSPDANVSDFGDAMWRAVTTMTTVGYGLFLPGVCGSHISMTLPTYLPPERARTII